MTRLEKITVLENEMKQAKLYKDLITQVLLLGDFGGTKILFMLLL